MKLVSNRHASSHERNHAYPAPEARTRINDSLDSGEPVDGIDDLRGYLMTHRDEEVIEKVENGEWLLVKDDAYYFDWGHLDKQAQEQKTAQRVSQISKNPLPEKKTEQFVLRILDSITGEPLADQNMWLVMGKDRTKRKTDKLGITYLSPFPPPESLADLQLQFPN